MYKMFVTNNSGNEDSFGYPTKEVKYHYLVKLRYLPGNSHLWLIEVKSLLALARIYGHEPMETSESCNNIAK